MQREQIRLTNPNCAHTTEACPNDLASDRSSLLHVLSLLTAAYLIHGRVMISIRQTSKLNDEFEEDGLGIGGDQAQNLRSAANSQTGRTFHGVPDNH
jgi:hypothetical protein